MELLGKDVIDANGRVVGKVADASVGERLTILTKRKLRVIRTAISPEKMPVSRLRDEIIRILATEVGPSISYARSRLQREISTALGVSPEEAFKDEVFARFLHDTDAGRKYMRLLKESIEEKGEVFELEERVDLSWDVVKAAGDVVLLNIPMELEKEVVIRIEAALCPHCETLLPLSKMEMSFCPFCGKTLKPEGFVKCPNCGQLNKPENEYCIRCGESLR